MGGAHVMTGQALIRDIDTCETADGEMAFWWFGQHSFVLKAGAHTIYLDPFLSPWPERLIAPLVSPEEVTHATIITGSHDHADHIDRDVWPALASASPQAKFLVPDLLRSRLAEELNIPAGRFVGLDDGTAAEIDGVRITGVAAAHEFLDPDPQTGRFPYLGYIFEVGGFTVYHAGDTCVYEGCRRS